MRTALRVWPLTAAALLFGAGPLSAQPGDVTATLAADRDRIMLWESVRATLTIDGPAPMRGAVELSSPLLTADADKSWRIRPEGEPTVEPLGGGRERWRRVFRLDPYPPGKPLRATFAPISVHGKPLPDPPSVEVTVERTGGENAPLPESLPVTTVEELPPKPVPPAATSRATAAVAAAVAVGCLALFVLTWRRARRPKPLPPGAWARGALAELDAEHLGGTDVAERVADVLRRFVERRFGVPATRLTTAELYDALGVQGWPVGNNRSLRALLDECDLAKFAGAAPDFDGCGRLIAAAREWLDRIDPPRPG